MQFQPSEDQQMLRDMVRQFVEKEARPTVAERDDQAIWPADLVKKMGELGLMGVAVSEDYATAPDGGEVGWVARWQLERMLEDAVFAMTETGEISEPITDGSGAIHIYALLETSESEEIEEERLEEIHAAGFQRWLEEVVRAPVDTWVDPDYAASATA